MQTRLERLPRSVALALLLALSAGAFAAPAAARNLLANSSVELGPDHRYAIGRWFMHGLPNTQLDESTKVHGKASLRVPFSVKGFAPDGPHGIELRDGVGVSVEKGKTYTFSIYLKTNVPDPTASIGISPIPPYEWRGQDIAREKITLGRRTTPQGFEYPWTRHSITFTADKTQDVFWVVTVGSKRPGAILWIDALQFEEGPLTDYHPMLPVEIGLFDPVIGHIHDPGAPFEVALNAYNDSAAPVRQRARLRIRNDVNDVVKERLVDVTVPAKGVLNSRIKLDTGGANGIFVAELTLPDGPAAYQQDTVFAVLPRPRPVVPEQANFGAYITPSEEALQVMSRAGFHWTATLTSAEYMANWSVVERRKGQYRWRDSDVDLFRRYGFEIMMNLEGWTCPGWACNLTNSERTEAFARYVEASTRHYRGKIRYFNLADEVHNKVPGSNMIGSGRAMWTKPEEYAAWHTAGATAAKRGNPDAQVVLNGDYAGYAPANLFKYMSPKTVDVVAGNYYPYPDQVRILKRQADAAGIPTVWAPGVAINTWPLYFRKYRPMNAKSVRYYEMMLQKIIRSFANGAQVIFHYTGTYVGNTNVYSVMEHDSSLETGGALFAGLAWLLDGFKAVHEVTVMRASNIEAYRFDRRDGNSVFTLWSNLPFESQSVIFKTPVRDVRVYDRRTSEIPVPAAGLATLALGDQSRYVIVPTATADAFEKSLNVARFKIARLPAAENFTRAGRYALETRLVGRRKDEKDIVLWYDAGEQGWVELLRSRAGQDAPVATLDAAGLTLDFRDVGKGRGGHLRVGGLSSDAFWGGRFWRSMPERGGLKWESGRLADENIDGRFMVPRSHDPSAIPGLAPISYVFEGMRGPDLVIETLGEQPSTRFPMPGGWDIYASRGQGSDRGMAIWRYVHAGKARERDLRVRIRVPSSG